MSALLEALMGSQYRAASDPYGISAQGIASAAPLLSSPYASTGKNVAASVGASLLAGLLGGLAQRRTDTRNQELLTLSKQYLGGDAATQAKLMQENPRLSSLALALQGSELEADRQAKQKERELELALQQKRQEMADRAQFEQQGIIPGVEQRFKTETELIEEREDIKGRKNPSGTKVNVNTATGLSAEAAAKIASEKAIVDEALDIARAIDEAGLSWGGLRAAQSFSGLDDEGVAQKLQNLADKVLRSRSGASAPAGEKEALQKIIAGDWTANPKVVSKLLRNFARSEAQSIKSKLNAGKSMLDGSLEAEIDTLLGATGSGQNSNVVVGPDGQEYVFVD